MNQKLWYGTPAGEWTEGLPIGTGRLAAMVMGAVKRERIALNHEWLWKGVNRLRDTSESSDMLEKVRELLLDGKYEEGTKAGNNAFGGSGGIGGKPNRVDPYQPAGDLYFELNHGPVHDYRRTLDLGTAAVTVTYAADNKKFSRQYIAHLEEDLILVRIDAGEEPFDCAVWLDRMHDPDCDLRFSADTGLLAMDGNIRDGLDFRVEARVWHRDGEVSVCRDRVVLAGTREVLLSVNIGTSARDGDPGEECGQKRLATHDWEKLLDAHVRKYSDLYGGIELTLPFDEPDLPTDERLRRLRDGEDDPGLPLLYFNYGRYLMCASSANAQLPANLQGKWNEDLNPPWGSDYHHDINLQMNYWPAEPGNLHACAEPLFTYLENFVPHGKKAARDLYGCAGICLPIQTDPWGRATPESRGWAVWIGAAAWLAQHMWWHYEYGRDEEFLRARAYPFIKEVAAFYETYLVEDDNGILQAVPSQSPENRFKDSGETFPVSLCVSATMDIQLAWDLLTHAVKAGEILGVDPEKRRLWRDMLGKLPEMKIGSKGQLLEWNREFEEVEPGHRHLSHLFGLFPGEQITPEETPELFKAAEKSLEIRLAHGGGQSGWSRAWVSCCFARLGRGEDAYEHLRRLIADYATGTLLDLHPPRIFQIEGNFGGAAAVLEMLLQSYNEEIHLLPALPSSWPSGKIRGLRARGGYTVDIEWQNGAVTNAGIVSLHDRECVVRAPADPWTVCDSSGGAVPARHENGRVFFPVKGGSTYELTPPGTASLRG